MQGKGGWTGLDHSLGNYRPEWSVRGARLIEMDADRCVQESEPYTLIMDNNMDAI